MNLSRRRFLAISACAMLPAASPPPERLVWRGVALGADASITLEGPRARTEPALAGALAAIEEAAAQFSLHDPASAISRLNRAGRLDAPSGAMTSLLETCRVVHRATDGLFDPTVQPVWQALATGGDPATARRTVGFGRVRLGADAILLGAGQALTLNGIAQGFATDRVADALRASGLKDVLVDMGEFRGAGRVWRLGIADAAGEMIGDLRLRDGAVATSSPRATEIGQGQPHILDPQGRRGPAWRTVTVEAATAVLADALSTAFALSTVGEIERVAQRLPGVRRVWLEDEGRRLSRLDLASR